MIALGCVTGRFQPVHRQHLELFAIALDTCAHLVVAVTNPDPAARRSEPSAAHRHTADANPFTYFERARLLAAALDDRGFGPRTTVVPFDLTRPALWPHYVPPDAHHYIRAYSAWEREKAAALTASGYAVTLIEGDPAQRVSAAVIRESLRAGDARWREIVAPGTAPLLDAFLAAEPMAQRG